MPLQFVRAGVFVGLAAVVNVSGAQVGDDSRGGADLDVLAGELVRLRGEVESLNAELNQLSEQHRAEMNALAAQKGDLEATRRREDLRIQQLESELADNRERAEQAGVSSEALVPVALEAVESLRSHIQASLPFKQDERLQALEELESQLGAGAVAPPRAINRLWGFYEDELRLTRENGLYSQVIPLSGQRVLADVAKLGTVAMYFETAEGDIGHAVSGNDGWRFETIDGGASRKQIKTLFDSLKKQIRTGYFTLPNASIRLEAES